MPNPLRIVHVIPADGRGGVETAARVMAERGDLNCDFKLLILSGPSSDPSNPSIVAQGYASALNPLAQLAAVRKILKLRPDVIVCSLWRSVPACLLAKLIRPKSKLVAFYHVTKRVHAPDTIMHVLINRWTDAIWADSDATLESVSTKRPSVQRRVISYIPERFEAANPLPTLQANFVSWGRIHYQKGLDRALHLVAALARMGIDVRFDIWGQDQGPKPELVKLAQKLGIADRVNFLGPLDHSLLPRVAASARFLLQLSRFEGAGVVIIEAMQLGLVPIVTPVGQAAKYCRDGKNAVVVDIDKLDDAAARIADILENREAYDRLRSNSLRTWRDAPLYPDDICAAAREVCMAP